jgi:DeoR/GlpR family transcriptional regulator of sugar metabolism
MPARESQRRRDEIVRLATTSGLAGELMARRVSAVYVLAHGAKLERRPFHAWARLDPGWTLVTDASAEPDHVDRLRNAGSTVVVAGVGEGVESSA